MKRHLLLALSIVFLSGSAFAQNNIRNFDAYQTREKAYRKNIAEKFKNHIPKGWVIESVAEGDLDNDSIPDIAFVASDREINDFLNDAPSGSSLYSKIFIFMNEGNQYSLFQQGSHYVDDRGAGTRGMPEAHLEINKGVLFVFMGTPAPSWFVTRLFRMEDHQLRLIGMEAGIVRSGIGVSESTSYNLLTGKCQKKVEFFVKTESEKKEIAKDLGLKEGSVWKRIKGNKKIYFGEKDDSLKCQ